MKELIGYETSDHTRFWNIDEARRHERRFDFGNQIDTAVKSDPRFARLDRDLLIDYFMQHGSTVGKLADSKIDARPASRIPAGYSGTLQDKLDRAKGPTTGALPHPDSPEGQRRRGAPNSVETSHVEREALSAVEKAVG